MLRKFFNLNFGEVSVEDVFRAIFILGLIPGILQGFFMIFGWNSTIFNIKAGGGTIVYMLVIYIFYILLLIALWKIVCELLFLVFKSLEVYIKKNR